MSPIKPKSTGVGPSAPSLRPVISTPVAKAAAPAAPAAKAETPDSGFRGARARRLSLTGGFKPVPPAQLKNDASLADGISALRRPMVAQAKAEAKPKVVGGLNIGQQGLADPAVPVARRAAAKAASSKVDWAHPEKTLEKFTQIDASRAGNDAVRCGAAVLVAGAVAAGPEQFKKGLENVSERARAVAGVYGNMADGAREAAENPDLPEAQRAQLLAFAEQADAFAVQADAAADALSKFAEKDPRKLTVGDLHAITEQVYVSANLDQRIINDRRFDPSNDQRNAYLSVDAMTTYSGMMWGAEAPLLSGQSITPMRVERDGSSHFVLAQPDGQVLYNPWPQKDGSAYVLGRDGKGAKVGSTNSADTLQGQTVASYGRRLPDRD